MSGRPLGAAYALREPVIGPVVTLCGAANLVISFMAVSSSMSSDGGNWPTKWKKGGRYVPSPA